MKSATPIFFLRAARLSEKILSGVKRIALQITTTGHLVIQIVQVIQPIAVQTLAFAELELDHPLPRPARLYRQV